MKLSDIFPCLRKNGINKSIDNDLVIIPQIKSQWSEMEIEVAELINFEREWNFTDKRQKVYLDPFLCSIAQGHTDYMIKEGKASHDNFAKRITQANFYMQVGYVGEIVAFGYATSKGVVNGWLNSPGHNAVIRNKRATHYGISIEENPDGRNYFTMLFAERL